MRERTERSMYFFSQMNVTEMNENKRYVKVLYEVEEVIKTDLKSVKQRKFIFVSELDSFVRTKILQAPKLANSLTIFFF